jgi:hypothetical protein
MCYDGGSRMKLRKQEAHKERHCDYCKDKDIFCEEGGKLYCIEHYYRRKYFIKLNEGKTKRFKSWLKENTLIIPPKEQNKLEILFKIFLSEYGENFMED